MPLLCGVKVLEEEERRERRKRERGAREWGEDFTH